MRAIFTYHSIDTSGSVISVAPRVFREHVGALIRSRARLMRLDDLANAPADERAIAVTFDDGFANFATYAWPILRDAGVPVTLFVVTNRAGETNDWNAGLPHRIPELPLLDWDAIGRLAEEGVSIASHTETHPDLRRADAEQLRDELHGAADRIAQLTGGPPKSLAYPFGYYDDAVLGEVRGAYQYACTTEMGVLSRAPDPHQLPRLDSFYYQRPDRIERFGSKGFRRHLWARGAARRVRATVTAALRTIA